MQAHRGVLQPKDGRPFIGRQTRRDSSGPAPTRRFSLRLWRNRYADPHREKGPPYPANARQGFPLLRENTKVGAEYLPSAGNPLVDCHEQEHPIAPCQRAIHARTLSDYLPAALPRRSRQGSARLPQRWSTAAARPAQGSPQSLPAPAPPSPQSPPSWR